MSNTDNELDEILVDIDLCDQFDIDHNFDNYVYAKKVLTKWQERKAVEARIDELKELSSFVNKGLVESYRIRRISALTKTLREDKA